MVSTKLTIKEAKQATVKELSDRITMLISDIAQVNIRIETSTNKVTIAQAAVHTVTMTVNSTASLLAIASENKVAAQILATQASAATQETFYDFNLYEQAIKDAQEANAALEEANSALEEANSELEEANTA